MIWVLLAALGVPIWLVVGGLVSALWNRRRVRRTPDAFPCKLRILSAEDEPASGVAGRRVADGSTTSCSCITAWRSRGPPPCRSGHRVRHPTGRIKLRGGSPSRSN